MHPIIFLQESSITVKEGRLRKEFASSSLEAMQASITSLPGLGQPITVDIRHNLLLGETRLRALRALHSLGLPAYFLGKRLAEGEVPCIIAVEVVDELDQLQMEYNENAIRTNFTFAENTAAIARIARIKDLEKSQSKKNLTAQKRREFSMVSQPLGIILKDKEVIKETAKANYETAVPSAEELREVTLALKVENAKSLNPELAKKLEGANSFKEAEKVLKQHEDAHMRATTALAVGKTFNASRHRVIQGNCLEELLKLKEKFPVCVTDPPYGINAHKFNDAGGKMGNFQHKYEDTPENFKKLMSDFLPKLGMVLEEKAHLYLACDISHFFWLKEKLEQLSSRNPWTVVRQPIIQYKTAGGRVPHPGFTPRNCYEVWLFAHRGGKSEHMMINNVLPCASSASIGHGAEKPVELLEIFLKRSCIAGENVIDPFAGSGSLVEAAHKLNLAATLIEQEPEYYGAIVERIANLSK